MQIFSYFPIIVLSYLSLLKGVSNLTPLLCCRDGSAVEYSFICNTQCSLMVSREANSCFKRAFPVQSLETLVRTFIYPIHTTCTSLPFPPTCDFYKHLLLCSPTHLFPSSPFTTLLFHITHSKLYCTKYQRVLSFHLCVSSAI